MKHYIIHSLNGQTERFNNHALVKCGLYQPMGAAMSETLFCATLFIVALILSFVI